MIRSRAQRISDGVGSRPMPGDTRQAPPFGPAAVAVHDDRDVARDRTVS
jgi:hypothetical protein